MAEKDLKANFDFVTKNKERLLKYYRDKFILVFDEIFHATTRHCNDVLSFY